MNCSLYINYLYVNLPSVLSEMREAKNPLAIAKEAWDLVASEPMGGKGFQ